MTHFAQSFRQILALSTTRNQSFFILLMTLSFSEGLSAQNVSTLTPQPFNASGDLSVDSQGNIYVANRGAVAHDNSGTAVYKVSPGGTVNLFASGFLFATGNAFDSQGYLYQSSYERNQVDKISPNGVVTQFAGPDTGIYTPLGLAFDSQGNLYVANCYLENNIIKITPAGAGSPFVVNSPLMDCPRGLAFDDQDNLYVTNWRNSLIVVVTPDGNASTIADTVEWTGVLGRNAYIIFAHDRLYFSSEGSNRIFELRLTGELIPLAGSGQLGRVDGPLLEASLQQPVGMGISPDGRFLYVNTSEHLTNWTPNVLRVIELPDMVAEFSINAGLNGNWWNGPNRNGEGVQVEVSDGGAAGPLLVATVYSYNAAGEQIFLIAVGTVDGDTAAVDVYITEDGQWGDDFDPALVTEAQWGTGTFTASSCDAMHMSLVPSAQFQGLGYTSVSIELTRLTTAAAPCPAGGAASSAEQSKAPELEPLASVNFNPGLNGNWWKGLDRDGEGVQIEISDGGGGNLTLVATLYSYFQGQQIFLIAVGTVTGDTVEVEVFITGGGIWGDSYDPELVYEAQWGTGTFTVNSCSSIDMQLQPNAEFQNMGYMNLAYELVRLTTPITPCPIDKQN